MTGAGVSAFAIYKQNPRKEDKSKKKRPKSAVEKPVEKKAKFVNEVDDEEEVPQLVDVNRVDNVLKKDEPNAQQKPNKKKKKKPNKKIKLRVSKSTNGVSCTSNGVTVKVPKPVKEQTCSGGSNQDNETLRLFKWLISPIPPETFFSEFWEKEPIYIERAAEHYYEHILTTQRLDRILRDNPIYYGRNVDVVSYEQGKKEVFNQEGRAAAAALWDYYANGCSIRLLNPQTYDRKVHLLLATLQEYFGCMAGANAYLTPPGSQGFAPHYDDIEAFVIQLEGRKHWRLYKPKGSDVLARDSSANLHRDQIGEPFMEVTVNAGDLLYFPRGVIHEGRTDSESHSFHITLSVYQHTAYADLLEHVLPQALKKAALENVDYRKGLPRNYLKHVGLVNKGKKSQTRQDILKTVKNLIGGLTHFLDVDSAADLMGKKFMEDAMPPVLSREETMLTSKGDGDYMANGKVYNRVEISLDTRVRLVRYYSLRVIKENDTVSKIYYSTDNARVYHGEEPQWLEIDSAMIPALERLQQAYPEHVEVECLPIEEDSAKVQLVADLWEKGLLVTKAPLSAFTDDDEEDDDHSDDFSDDDATIEIMEI